MAVERRQRLKFKGLARSRARLGADVLRRILAYNAKHIELEFLTPLDEVNIGAIIDRLEERLTELVPV